LARNGSLPSALLARRHFRDELIVGFSRWCGKDTDARWSNPMDLAKKLSNRHAIGRYVLCNLMKAMVPLFCGAIVTDASIRKANVSVEKSATEDS
jgi:hypothetical protein